MRLTTILGLLLAMVAFGCEGTDGPGSSDDDSSSDGDSDGDADGDADGDSDGDTDPGIFGNLSGTVMAPSGTFPISGALVYITDGDGSEIPGHTFCYECEDMTGKKWTLSEADGTWSIEQVPAGTHNIVTRKGFFQRQRQLVVTGDANQDVPVEYTTLPPAASGDGMDQIPSYALTLNSWDRPHNLLAKLGIGELGGDGELVFGTEQFSIFNDDVSQTGYPDSANIYTDDETMQQYHMIFMPCTSSHLKYSHMSDPVVIDQIREYVASGGKYYGTCYGYDWIEQPFPEYIEFPGDDSQSLAGTHSPWDGHLTIIDSGESNGMRPWLQVVTTENVDNFYVSGAWVHGEYTNDVNDGMGLDEDDGWVKPFTWGVANDPGAGWVCGSEGCPITVTYNFGCGKIFFSAFQVVESSSSVMIRPQEYVLLYLILEVGVCEGDYIPPE